MSLLQRFLHVLASPDIAVVLLMAGLLGLYVEFTQPGLVAPGVLGAVCLVLGAISLQILPFSWLGLIVFFGRRRAARSRRCSSRRSGCSSCWASRACWSAA